ncbi:hypothetical protein B0H11DRAFT_2188577 [Mycena galericulata]|nr:hypothetical protein B0H11DRAFT_2188577 [Mycena galericulata]
MCSRATTGVTHTPVCARPVTIIRGHSASVIFGYRSLSVSYEFVHILAQNTNKYLGGVSLMREVNEKGEVKEGSVRLFATASRVTCAAAQPPVTLFLSVLLNAGRIEDGIFISPFTWSADICETRDFFPPTRYHRDRIVKIKIIVHKSEPHMHRVVVVSLAREVRRVGVVTSSDPIPTTASYNQNCMLDVPVLDEAPSKAAGQYIADGKGQFLRTRPLTTTTTFLSLSGY